MPKKFVFNPGPNEFSCTLQSHRCSAVSTSTNKRCKKQVVIGQPFCWVHLQQNQNLRIKQSNIPNAGLGLFAVRKNAPATAVIFHPHQKITDYSGELINHAELNKRYGDFTAPYAIQVRHTVPYFYEDAACKRGAGAIANHSNTNANAELITTYDPHLRHDIALLEATTPIRNNEEILVDYGDEYLFDEDVAYSTKNDKKKKKNR